MMEIKNCDNSSVELTLVLKADDIEKSYSEKLKEYTKKMTIKGFRQGKAPLSVIEKKFGNEIREEVTFSLMEENLKNSYKDMDEKNKPLPYSTPVLQNEESLLPFKPNTDITYTVLYDVMPSFELLQYTNLEIECSCVNVSNEDIEKEIESIRQKNALVISKDGKVEKSDIVTIDYVEIDNENKEVEYTKRNDFTFTTGSSYNFYKIDEDILGMSKGETKVIEKTYNDDNTIAPEYTGKTIKIRVTVKDIKRKEIPQLDDEFAQDVKSSYKTLSDMREDIKQTLEKQVEQTNESIKLTALLKKILEKTEIKLPASMIETQLEQEWNEYSAQLKQSSKDVERYLSSDTFKENFLSSIRSDTINKLKEQLVLNKISDILNFDFTDEEISKKIKDYGDNINEDNANYDFFKQYAKDDLKFSKTKEYLLKNNKFINTKDTNIEKEN